MPFARLIAIAAAASAPSADDYRFAYSYPVVAARIPTLRRWLDADKARLRVHTARGAAAERVDATRNGFPFRRFETQKVWKVVTDTPRLLSLSAQSYKYTGGAHGNSATATLVWDKASRQRLAPIALFTAPAALEAAVRTSYCQRLKAERTRRLGAAVGGGADDPFARCPAFKDLVLLLGSTDRRHIDRIGLVADPYVAGSYAEGRYEIDLPVTAALLATVKPAYRAAFSIG